ncbi:MAG: hypothetical protein ACO1SV_02065 [Fimbriimonas sp.]
MGDNARVRLAIACRMALTAWRTNVVDVPFPSLHELVDWPTSQRADLDDEDLVTMLRFAGYLGDAIGHGAPPLKGLSHAEAMVELETNAGRLERGEPLTEYAQTFARDPERGFSPFR